MADGLFQLHQDAVRRGRMDERDQRAFGAFSGRLVDQSRAAGLQVGDSGSDVRHPQGDVVEARAALVDVLGNRRLRRRGLEQLELRFPHRHQVRADVLRRDLFGRFDLETERVAIKRERHRQILHRDTDVIENRFHRLELATKTRNNLRTRFFS